MPTAPARPCSRPRCPHLVPCPDHGSGARTYQERQQAEPWRALYKTRRWQRLRRLKLSSAPLCQCEACAAGRPRLATVVDHIVPHRGDRGLFYDWDNLQSMAKACHDRKTARETNRGRS